MGPNRVDYSWCAAAHKETLVINKVLLLSASCGRPIIFATQVLVL